MEAEIRENKKEIDVFKDDVEDVRKKGNINADDIAQNSSRINELVMRMDKNDKDKATQDTKIKEVEAILDLHKENYDDVTLGGDSKEELRSIRS